MQTRVFKTVDGQEILADIHSPSYARDGENLPAVLFIHGGGLIMGHRKMIDPSHIQAFHKGGFHMADENDARKSVGVGTISESGPNDSMQRHLGRGLFYLHCRQQGIWLREVTGHNPNDQAWFAQYEPIRNVSAAYPPTMLLHGQADTDVPYDQSVRMQQELARHGIAHEFISNPDWGHAFLYVPNNPTVDKAFLQIIAFLQQHV